ncbi:MAG: glutamine--tRNA ligase/YqeY domain fusion protein [Defluviitaleaceae bacterium]|nr:glutamine--tRNA ligase/YqeY domain fusion protein [Defluviitaleaceae bacterium]
MKENTPSSFIHHAISEDLGDNTNRLITRFPPEPAGYLHIGHAKAICINFGLAEHYGGLCNLRFDETDPTKKDMEYYVESIKDTIRWLGFQWNELCYASNYFEQFYEYAVLLIKKGVAYVCDLSAEETRQYRGTLNEPGKNSPYRNRNIDENLDLFEKMKAGEFPDGARTLRAKIDMASPNINMRDPIIYRIIHAPHYNTGDKWCVYPTYDYAHPLEDAIEGVTHSLCGVEFEDHRPLYDWFVNQIGFDPAPRQIEFAELHLSNTVLGKRHIRKLIEDGIADGWDDPRLMTLPGLRRRGYTPTAIRDFIERIGLSKAQSTVDIGFLEHCLREDISLSSKVVMAVLDPIKLIITNYPESQTEMVEMPNNPKNLDLGTRQMPFSREVYIERSDFEEIAPPKYHRLYPGNEVRLAGAYFVTCTDFVKDESGRIVEVHATYDPATKSGSGFSERKVKGTIHWVSCAQAVKIRCNLYDYLFFDDDTQESGFRFNENSLVVAENAVAEPSIINAGQEDRFQFMRNAYFCLDSKTSSPNNPVFNRIVEIKSSYKPT